LSSGLLSPSGLGDVNRSRVLQAFCDHGPLTRAELAKMAGVTRATIGNIVQSLVDSDLVEEGRPSKPNGRVGKPGRPLWFTARAGLTAAAAIGPGEIDLALVNARGEVLEQRNLTFDAADPGGASVRKAITRGLDRLVTAAGDDLLGIGVAVPGVCDSERGDIIGSGQVPGLEGTRLVETVVERFGVRTIVDNDSRAQALGEKWFGEGRGVPTFASIQTGHGLGVGLVIDGTVYRGASGRTGELGHTCVVTGGDRCRCGLAGCWETIATLRWLRAEAAVRQVDQAATLDSSALVAAVGRGDARASALLDDYAANLAVGMANLLQVFGPQLLILHGDVVGGGEVLRAAIERATRDRVLGHIRSQVRVVLSELDQRAGLLGAAGLVLSESFHLVT
jgi:predicted NBD/HSP70 family sugar kinase